jgi:alpha-L-arabinofuranosidase
VDCYLEGKLLMTYQEPQKFFSIAGKDEQTGDIVLKFVNASGEICNTNFSISGDLGIKPNAEWIILCAPSANDENSFTTPEQFIPRSQPINNASDSFELSVKPYSVNVIRLHTQ